MSPQLRSTASKLRLRPQAQASSRCGGGAIGLAQRQPFSSLRKAPAVLPGPPTVRWGCEVDVHPRSGRPRPSVKRDGDPEPRGARAPVSHWVRARRGGVPANGQGLVLEPNRNFHYSQARPSIGGLVTSVSERQPTSYIRNQYLHLSGHQPKIRAVAGPGLGGRRLSGHKPVPICLATSSAVLRFSDVRPRGECDPIVLAVEARRVTPMFRATFQIEPEVAARGDPSALPVSLYCRRVGPVVWPC